MSPAKIAASRRCLFCSTMSPIPGKARDDQSMEGNRRCLPDSVATSALGQKAKSEAALSMSEAGVQAEVNQRKADIAARISVVGVRAEVDPGRRDFRL